MNTFCYKGGLEGSGS